MPDIAAPIVFTSTRVRLSAVERYALASVLVMFIALLVLAWHWNVIDLDSLFGLFPFAETVFWMLLGVLLLVFVFAVVAQHYLASGRLVLDAEAMRLDANAPAILAPFGFVSCRMAWSELAYMSYLPDRAILELRYRSDSAPPVSINVDAWHQESPDLVTTVILRARELGEPDLVRVMRELGVLDSSTRDAD